MLLRFIALISARPPEFEVAFAVTVLIKLLVMSISEAFILPLILLLIEDVTLLVISRTEPETNP